MSFMIIFGILVVAILALLFIANYQTNKLEVERRKRREFEERCSVLENRDQTTIHRVVAEEVARHGGGGQEIVNIMRSGYATHYNQFRDGIVSEFLDKSQKAMGEIAEGLTQRLIESVNPIFNDVSQDENFILPNGVRHASKKGRSLVVLVENPPGLRASTFTGDCLNSTEKTIGTKVIHDSERRGSLACYRFNLSYPYTYFLFTFRLSQKERAEFEKFNIFFRNKPLTSVRQSLYPAPLLNLGDGSADGGAGYVCMGDSTYDSTSYKSISQICDDLIAEWWSRAYHNDLNEADFRNSPLGNIRRWAKKSSADPYWACSVKWKHGINTKKALDAAMPSSGGTTSPANIAAGECRAQVEQAAYDITARINNALIELKPENELTVQQFEPAAINAFQNSLNILTNKIIGRIT